MWNAYMQIFFNEMCKYEYRVGKYISRVRLFENFIVIDFSRISNVLNRKFSDLIFVYRFEFQVIAVLVCSDSAIFTQTC